MKNVLLQLKAQSFYNHRIEVKITSILMCTLFLLSNPIHGQITLEKVINNADAPIKYVKFSQLGEKYVINSDTGTTYRIYNSDFSLYKTVSLPKEVNGFYSKITNHISDNLFNTDSKIEFGLFYTNGDDYYYHKYIVFSEDGTKVFEIDSVMTENGGDGNGLKLLNTNNYVMYYNTSTGWKLFAQTTSMPRDAKTNKIKIYSLPGSMPLVTSSINPIKDVPFNLSFPYPNPSSSYASIDFKLPETINEGEIIIYNDQGIIMKTLKVDNTFGMVLLNNSDLSSGTYYYLIKAGNNVSETKKMVIIP